MDPQAFFENYSNSEDFEVADELIEFLDIALWWKKWFATNK